MNPPKNRKVLAVWLGSELKLYQQRVILLFFYLRQVHGVNLTCQYALKRISFACLPTGYILFPTLFVSFRLYLESTIEGLTYEAKKNNNGRWRELFYFA